MYPKWCFSCTTIYFILVPNTTPPVSEREVTCQYLCRCSAAAECANPDTVQRSLHQCKTLQPCPSAPMCGRLSRMSRLCSGGGPVSEQRLGWCGCTGKVWFCHAGVYFNGTEMYCSYPKRWIHVVLELSNPWQTVQKNQDFQDSVGFLKGRTICWRNVIGGTHFCTPNTFKKHMASICLFDLF